MDVKGTLEKQLGPLPLWGWGVAIAGAVIAFIILPKVLSHFGGQSQDSGTNNAGMGVDPSSGLPTGLLPGGGTAPTADNGNQLNDILAQEQAIVSGQQAMQDEFKTFMDEVLGIRNGQTPPDAPPGPMGGPNAPPTPIPAGGPMPPIRPPAPGPIPPVRPPGGHPGPQPPVRPPGGHPGPQPPVRPPAGGPIPPVRPPNPFPRRYTIKPGDTLSKIAAALGISVTQLGEMNSAELQQYASQHGIVGRSKYGNYPRAWDYIYPGEELRW